MSEKNETWWRDTLWVVWVPFILVVANGVWVAARFRIAAALAPDLANWLVKREEFTVASEAHARLALDVRADARVTQELLERALQELETLRKGVGEDLRCLHARLDQHISTHPTHKENPHG